MRSTPAKFAWGLLLLYSRSTEESNPLLANATSSCETPPVASFAVTDTTVTAVAETWTQPSKPLNLTRTQSFSRASTAS